MKKNKKISLILNIIILVLAIIGTILTFGEIYFVQTKIIEHGIKLLKFFTIQSNILAGVTALIYIVYLIKTNKKNEKIPTFVYILRFIATVDLVITFLVVALFLGFITDEGYFSLYVNANFLFHFAIPIINFISFAFFEKAPKFKFNYNFFGISHLIIYSIFYLIVVLTHFENGSVDIYYDWYGFAQFGFGIALVYALVVLALGFLISFVLYKINNKYN